MKTRLQKIITAEGLTPTQFAELIGMQRSSVSHILSGRNNPSFDMLQNILSKFSKINPNWLILGTGDMYQKVVQTDLFSEIHNKKHSTTPATSSKKDANASIQKTGEIKASEKPIFRKDVERVIIFYKDKTFTEYFPG